MTDSRPVNLSEHVTTGFGLTADHMVYLYEITLVAAPGTPIIRMTDGATVNWQGNTYEQAPIKLSGLSKTSDEQKNRPKLTLIDRLDLLIEFAFAGYLDYGVVVRREVLRAHLEQDVNLSVLKKWYISRVTEVVTGQAVSVELRSLSDGPSMLLPARMYIPPEFPFVTV